ncbi:MAG: PAS domain S-box protein [Bryobacteraceae bacterium]
MKNATTHLRETHGIVFAEPEVSVEQAQVALQQERSISSAILDTVPALVVVLDPDFKIIRFNRSCELSTGYLFAELKDKEAWRLFYSEAEGEPFRAAIRRLRKNERPAQFEAYWRKRDGSAVMISWTITALFDHAAGIRLIIASGIDVTENKRLENAVIEISGREQRRIGQDLHDGLGQHLTGIAFLAKVQEQRLSEKSLPEASEAAKIVHLVNQAIHKTRELARGLLPVLSGPYGLLAALQECATQVEDIFRVECRFECDDSLSFQDDGVANHLFRIAQEAVHNAIRHGKAQHIVIGLRGAEEGVLSIRDDGSGMSLEPSSCAGMGLRIMDYRARMIGGSLSIQPAGERGTLVACLFPLRKWNDIQ